MTQKVIMNKLLDTIAYYLRFPYIKKIDDYHYKLDDCDLYIKFIKDDVHFIFKYKRVQVDEYTAHNISSKTTEDFEKIGEIVLNNIRLIGMYNKYSKKIDNETKISEKVKQELKEDIKVINHPLYKDVKEWIYDSFSFMDGIGYDINYDDNFLEEGIKIFSIAVDGLTKSDTEKGKENLSKFLPKKLKSEFPILKTLVKKDGDLYIMYIGLLNKVIDKDSSRYNSYLYSAEVMDAMNPMSENKESKMANEEQKLKALKQVLVKEYDYSKKEAEEDAQNLIDVGDYVVYTSDEADEAVKDDITSFIDDLGLEAFSENFQEIIIENYLDQKWFKDWYKEDLEYYWNELEDDEKQQELKMYEAKNKDEYIEKRMNEIEFSNNRYFSDEFIDIFGKDELTKLIKDGKVKLDIDGIVEECILTDGRGHFLSIYDGKEHEINIDGKWYYVYRRD